MNSFLNKYFELDLYCDYFWILLKIFSSNQLINKYNRVMNEEHTVKTKKLILNRLSELICKSVGEHESTKIEIVDCENFLVVKGFTSSNEILDLNDLKIKFIEKFNTESEKPIIGNTIDLIQYNSKLDTPNKLSFDFFNSENLKSPNCLQDFTIEPLVIKSEFPFGRSFSQGKILYYYAKHIAYNLQSKYGWDRLTICIPEKNIEEELQIFVDTCQVENLYLKSAILDAFDFNYLGFQNKLNESDWWISIAEEIDPSGVKSLNEDFILF